MASWCCLLLLFLVPAALGQVGAPPPPPASTCTTDPCLKDCTGCDPGELIADPEDCHRYYVCDGAGDIEFPEPLYCSPGEVFNSSLHQCDPHGDCNICRRQCHYNCAFSPNHKISYFYNCNSYFDCDASNIPGQVQACPSHKPYFDGIDCQTNETLCCHCHPYCYKTDVGKMVKDPKDCRNYYACHGEGIPSGQGHCAPGEFFEVDSCSSHATCNTVCKNVVGVDGCVDPYTCEETGYFPKCPSQCTPHFYYCPKISNIYIDSEECPTGYVFHPDLHVCVRGEDCPY